MRDRKYIIGRLKEARKYLVSALNKLSTARTMSILDIFFSGGFSFFSDLMEHEKYREAVDDIRVARSIIMDIKDDIRELRELYDIEIKDDSFLGFMMDVAFDNFLFDLFRHSRIKKLRKIVHRWIRDVDNAILKLSREGVVYREVPVRRERRSRPPESGENVYCKNCGKLIPPYAKFCPYCGAKQ
ncbi:MAG: zinc ribbon domain-containing protein [Candidatus Asgardarchaeia archaeon]